MAPSDGDALLISRMNRDPGLARTCFRLRLVGLARERSASSETPSYRCRSSSRFTAAISPRIPRGSVTARLDEALEHLGRPAGGQGVARDVRAFAQVDRLARGHQ